MRNIDEYQKNYLVDDFEEYQVRFRQRKMKELVQGRGNLKILEIGCGLNSFCNCIDVFESYTIVEPGEVFIEEAKRQLKDKKVKFIKGLFEESVETLLCNSYDLIIVSALLHEVEHPKRLLKGLKQVAVENTIIHINVPNALSFHRVLAMNVGLITSLYEPSDRNILLQQNNIYDLDSLKKLCTDEGFFVIDSGSYFIKPFSHEQMSGLLKNGIITESVLDGFYNMIDYFPEYGSEIFVNIGTLTH